MNHQFCVGWPLDHDTHVAKSAHGRKAILACQETADLGNPFGDAAEHNGAVRHGLVARHGYYGITDGRWLNQVVHLGIASRRLIDRVGIGTQDPK